MAEEKNEPLSHFVSGAIVGLILVMYSLVLNLMGEMTNTTLARLSYVLTIGAVLAAVLMYAKSIDHRAEFGKLFGYGFKVTALATLILLAFTVIYFMIFPGTKDVIFDKMREQMLMQGQQISEEQIDASLGFVKSYFMPFMIASVLFMTLILGLIGSLLGAAIAKKKPVTPFN